MKFDIDVIIKKNNTTEQVNLNGIDQFSKL